MPVACFIASILSIRIFINVEMNIFVRILIMIGVIDEKYIFYGTDYCAVFCLPDTECCCKNMGE